MIEPQQPEEWLALVRSCEQEGELFRAYDLARQALEQFPDDLALKHLAVLCLASTGAHAKHGELFERFRLDGAVGASLSSGLALDIAALRSRLVKDEALAVTRPAASRAALAGPPRLRRGLSQGQAAGNPEAYYPE